MPIALLLSAVLAFASIPPAAHHTRHVPVHHRARHAHHRPHRAARHFGVTRSMMRDVSRVNVCEEGGRWHVDGPTFFGGLGWLHPTWLMFRRPEWPQNMADAPPYMQANAMWRFVWHFNVPMPDQHGCTGGY